MNLDSMSGPGCFARAARTAKRAPIGAVRRGLRPGFTLIEMMVTVAIVAILAAIAIPSYTQFIARGHRNDAKAALLAAAQFQERWRTENNGYLPSPPGALPLGLQVSPPTGRTQYTIGMASTATTYALTATRTAAGVMAADPCGDFTLNQMGTKAIQGNDPSMDVNLCWQR